MAKHIIQLSEISSNLFTESKFMLTFKVLKTNLKIPIIIDDFELPIITMNILNQDKIKDSSSFIGYKIIEAFDISVKEILVDKFCEGIFSASITLLQGTKTVKVNVKIAEALMLSMYKNCDIYIENEVLDATAIEENLLDTPINNDLEQLKILEEYLAQLLKEENYKEATIIRDEIKKLKDLL